MSKMKDHLVKALKKQNAQTWNPYAHGSPVNLLTVIATVF